MKTKAKDAHRKTAERIVRAYACSMDSYWYDSEFRLVKAIARALRRVEREISPLPPQVHRAQERMEKRFGSDAFRGVLKDASKKMKATPEWAQSPDYRRESRRLDKEIKAKR